MRCGGGLLFDPILIKVESVFCCINLSRNFLDLICKAVDFLSERLSFNVTNPTWLSIEQLICITLSLTFYDFDLNYLAFMKRKTHLFSWCILILVCNGFFVFFFSSICDFKSLISTLCIVRNLL